MIPVFLNNDFQTCGGLDPEVFQSILPNPLRSMGVRSQENDHNSKEIIEEIILKCGKYIRIYNFSYGSIPSNAEGSWSPPIYSRYHSLDRDFLRDNSFRCLLY